MYHSTQLTTTTPSVSNSLNRSPWRRGFLLIPLAFAAACLALSPPARAVCQEGCDLSNSNTFLGDNVLTLNTTGSGNTGIGASALASNTTGNNNTANGFEALLSNTAGLANTATGYFALIDNITGFENTATGYQALESNTIGFNNTADGATALESNTTGSENTANGVQALYSNTTGNNNAATGYWALLSNITGNNNTATGFWALVGNTTGNNNTASGVFALLNNTGSNNIGLGQLAGSNLTTGSSNIDIGNVGVAGESKTIRVGTKQTHKATFIAGISGATVAGGVGVIVDTNGHLGTVVSSERYKDAIKPMDKASDAILALKPVTFRYKQELDPAGIPQFGLVAEQVEKVNPDLVARDDQGKAYTVRYEAVNAMLLNEFLKEHCKVEEQTRTNQEQQVTIAELRASVAQQSKEITALTECSKEQAAQIRKVNDEVEVRKSALRVAANDQ